MESERISWPAESVTFTKAEMLDLVLPALDEAIDQLGLSVVQSDLVEIRSIVFHRLEGH